jgi:hypothetical protein
LETLDSDKPVATRKGVAFSFLVRGKIGTRYWLCNVTLHLGGLLSIHRLQIANILCTILILIHYDENSSRRMLDQVRERILSLLASCHTDDPICIC